MAQVTVPQSIVALAISAFIAVAPSQLCGRMGIPSYRPPRPAGVLTENAQSACVLMTMALRLGLLRL